MSDKKNELLKETPTDHKIHDLIKNRWSPRKFADTPVSDTDLQSLFEAGRWAASSNNFQPWKIVWGKKGSETYDRIYETLAEFNQGWADNAPVLLLGAYDKKTPDGKDNFHALHDLGMFAANMTIQAQSMGIAMHQMAGFDHEKAHKTFKFPEDHHMATAIAVGYYGGEMDDLSGDLKKEEKKDRQRKKQDEFVFNGNYVDRADVSEDK
ncbi:Nitroreductase [Nonlabens sp. Hel1_33_55]|uniref:nitroreductase family protein n=1 Tax=Nonlabens sp. Hel1_33_55 TaxID=1336802 RepID=UPI000875C28D|nr:nitroreductase family protein [Nonlabens sp. Hel1_33_55]SCY04828.1 Nitroreductase [Nonlabens sp. Hel1_33_55]